ncbi:MAG: flagellar cap protein FliD N-terminal domain-containing protein, partial [Pseudomonadota bacterium]
MSSITFSGLATGLDTSAIIEKLVSLEKAQIPGLETKKSNLQIQLATIGNLVTKLNALKTAAEGLDSTSELSEYTATSSDTNVITATTSGSASPGLYGIEVQQLAQAEHTRLEGTAGGFASSAFDFSTGGYLRITVGATTSDVQYGATESL